MTKLTVLMTVFNGEAYLHECVESILNQTFTDFQFLILDNASSDNSKDIIRSFHDPRIRLVELPKDIGQAAALNKGLEMIDTPLIARMDADDISRPQRFSRQIEFMENHPDVGVCGTFVTAFKGKMRFHWSYPCHPPDIKVKLLFECSLAHPTVMMRKNLLDMFGLRYNERLEHSNDWELWQRSARYFDLANIPESLLEYRIHDKSESSKTLHLQKIAAEKLDSASLSFLGLERHPLRRIHRDVSFETSNMKNREREFLIQTRDWLNTLREANCSHHVYNEEALNCFLKKRMFIVLTMNTRHWKLALKYYFKYNLMKYVHWIWSFKFMIKNILSVLGIHLLKGQTYSRRT